MPKTKFLRFGRLFKYSTYPSEYTPLDEVPSIIRALLAFAKHQYGEIYDGVRLEFHGTGCATPEYCESHVGLNADAPLLYIHYTPTPRNFVIVPQKMP